MGVPGVCFGDLGVFSLTHHCRSEPFMLPHYALEQHRPCVAIRLREARQRLLDDVLLLGG